MPAVKFAITVPYGLDSWKLSFQLFHRDYFNGVELPLDFYLSPDLPKLLRRHGLAVVNVNSLTEKSISRNIADQSENVQREFLATIGEALLSPRQTRLEGFALDLGFEPGSSDPSRARRRVDFLKRFGNVLLKSGRRLRVPVRLPDNLDPFQHASFANLVCEQTLCRNVKICLDVHPHELRDSVPPEAILRGYRFELDMLRIVYEPETGNHLTAKLLGYWLAPLAELGLAHVPVVLCPKLHNFTAFELEVGRITNVAEELKSSLSQAVGL